MGYGVVGFQPVLYLVLFDLVEVVEGGMVCGCRYPSVSRVPAVRDIERFQRPFDIMLFYTELLVFVILNWG